VSPVTASLDLPVADSALADTVRTGLEDVEKVLREAVAQADRLADDASRHLIEAGGKRVRPMLTLLSSLLGAGVGPDVVKAAAVVELTHLASLYHDDVMDSAPLRRGAPAAHEVWGNTVAILVGDLLFARASLLVAELGPEAVQVQASTFERLCLGQLHETQGPAPADDPVEHYIQVLADKTGSLIATAGRFGAEFAGCPSSIVDVMVEYGERVGVAFQLADDVIDLAGVDSGKTPGTDLREGVPTMPVLLARRAAGEGDEAALAVVARLDADLSDDAALEAAVTALRESPALEAARAEAVRYAEEAIASLSPLPEGPAKQALADFAQAVVVRTR
jgi:geranylgeranyl pyrophosphate synthase